MGEVKWLETEYNRASTKIDGTTRLTCEMVVIRLHDAWTRFCREVIIRSAIGNINTLGGMRLVPVVGVTDRASAIEALMNTYRKRTYEPRWGDASECLDAATRLKIGNIATVSAAIGATNSPAESIRHVRNFYAHRKEGSAARAITTGCFYGAKYPDVFQLRQYTTGGVTVVASWTSGLILIATAAVQ